jgi:hypothetical protein
LLSEALQMAKKCCCIVGWNIGEFIALWVI